MTTGQGMQSQVEKIDERESEVVAPQSVAPEARSQRIIAVASGKGGVGKSNLAINLGITLTRFGHRVMLMDADLGMANVDLLLGLAPKYNLGHVFSGKKEIHDVMMTGPSGVRVLPASSGGRRSEEVGFKEKEKVFEEIRTQHEIADLVFVDTGGGLAEDVLDFLILADEVLLVTTPEPTSIVDSYGIVKVLARERKSTTLHLVVNMANDQYDAGHVVNTMELVTKQFFNVTLQDLGWLGYDPMVSRAVRQQQPFVELYPGCRASHAVHKIATRFADYKVDFLVEHGLRGMINRIRNLFT